MIIQHFIGAPDNMDGRCEAEVATYKKLNALGIAYETYLHPATFTMEECEAVNQAIGAHVFKNLFLCNRQKTQFYLLLMPADKPFKTKFLSTQLGCARLSFAEEESMVELLHIHPGAVSPMGLMNDVEGRVRLVVDEDLLREKWVGCHPCVNTATLKLLLQDILRTFASATQHDFTIVSLPIES